MGWRLIGWAIASLIIGVAISILMAPDMPSPGEPDLGDLNVPQVKEGALLYDVLGTTKIASGTFLFYYGNRTVELREKIDTGWGSHEHITVGWDYYLTFAMGICLGPVDTLYTIFMGDDCVWQGELTRPESGGEKTIILSTIGSSTTFPSILAALSSIALWTSGLQESVIGTMTFYFGTDDQVPNAQITTDMAAGLTDMPKNLPYRNMCWAYLKDIYLGGYNRCPNFKFVIQKKLTSLPFDP